MKLDRLTDFLPRGFGLGSDRLCAHFARHVGETTAYDVKFVALGYVEERDTYEVAPLSASDGTVRFSVDRQRRFGDVGKDPTSIHGFPTEEIDIPLRDGDSVAFAVAMAVASVHFRAKPDDVGVIDELAPDHELARAHRAIEARRSEASVDEEYRGPGGL